MGYFDGKEALGFITSLNKPPVRCCHGNRVFMITAYWIKALYVKFQYQLKGVSSTIACNKTSE